MFVKIKLTKLAWPSSESREGGHNKTPWQSIGHRISVESGLLLQTGIAIDVIFAS